MPRQGRYEHYFQDLQHAYESLQDVLIPRGLYVELSILLASVLRHPKELKDVSIELVVRSRAHGSIVWRASESLRVPGKAKLRSIASVLFGLMMRAAIDIDEKPPLPGSGQSRLPGGART